MIQQLSQIAEWMVDTFSFIDFPFDLNYPHTLVKS